MAELNIIASTWQDLATVCRLIREHVFIIEQQIDAVDEWDDLDAVSQHFVVYQAEQAIATARLLPNHHVGRVAVLQAYRGQGVGRKLMQAVVLAAKRQGRPYVKLSSQVHAIGFYQTLGFIVCGDEYLDCNIPHRDMCLIF